ncbi:30S ribosomal protein S4e [Candidatus Woesearchaeota archaeon]|jgi:small subunit ribosomal protein S4e|nr:30S ribosomal protein S4e [Candidatus Woesearchaeota archaeon]MBT4114760.1 30S ribosomal protein S4e [Candidatus Woesearchaeota archaeon]MBT4248133.1 30S ribosomal protein S4e [Candidatus Woesearchaeota archaeon]
MSKKQHLSRLAAPRTWPIKRKQSKWTAKQLPGAHNMKTSMPLVVILRDILDIAPTSKTIKNLLNAKEILVNNKAVGEVRFATGLFDVISIPKLKVHYRIVLSKQGKLNPIKIADNEADTMLLRVEDKKSVSKKKTQINLNNGWNLLVDKDDYKTNDAIMFNTKTKKVSKKLSLEKGASVYLIGGKHAGRVAKLMELRETGILRKHKVATVQIGKDAVDSALHNIIVVGRAKTEISLNSTK